MMIATLNKMPEEPSQFMKDYISLHYFFEQEKNASIESQKDDTELRARVRSKDLVKLRQEVQIMKEENARFNNLKVAFLGFTKKMNEISKDGYQQSDQ